MDNNQNDNEMRFNKLYELLGEDINKLYEKEEESEVREEPSYLSSIDDKKEEVREENNFVDRFNVFNNEEEKKENMTLESHEVVSEPVVKFEEKPVEQPVITIPVEADEEIDDTHLDNNIDDDEKVEKEQHEEIKIEEEPKGNSFADQFNIFGTEEVKKENEQSVINVSTKVDEEIKDTNQEKKHEDNNFVDTFNIFGDKKNNENEKELHQLFSNTTEELNGKEEVEEIKEEAPKVKEGDLEKVAEDIEENIEPTKVEISEKLNIEEDKKIEDNNIENHDSNIVRNKTFISKRDFEDDINENEDGKVVTFMRSKKFLGIMLILIFIAVVVLTIKTFYFGRKANIYNEYTNEIDHGDTNTVVYQEGDIDNNVLRKVAAQELISCISTPVDTAKLPESVNSVVGEINNYYRSSVGYFSFLYKDIFTGFTVSYNEDGKIFAASTIKAPVNIYLYEMAKEGKVNLNDKLTYTSNYYNSGTGVLKNKEVNTEYTIRELSEYAIRNSDNAAHNMLMDKYGRSNIKEFWANKGTNTILTGNDNWGLITAHDAKIYMSELYNFYIEDKEYGEELMNNFINAKTKFITGKNDYIVGNKSGWSGASQHDVSIVFAENPYMVVAFSNMGNNKNYMEHFNKVNDLAYKLHQEYWKYKLEACGNIKQYD